MPTSPIPDTCRIDTTDSALQQRRKKVESFTLCCFIHTLPNVLLLGSNVVSSVRIVAKTPISFVTSVTLSGLLLLPLLPS